MIYKAEDLWNKDAPYLEHGFKYLKKITIGGHTRYFYTPEALRAYYQADKKASQVSRDVANAKIDARTTLTTLRSTPEEREANQNAAAVLKTYNNARAAVQPHVRTAKLIGTSLLGSKSKKTLRKRAANSLLRERGMITIGKLMKRLGG